MPQIPAVEDEQGHPDHIVSDVELRARDSRLSAVMESICDGVATIDPHGRVTLLNPAGTRMTGVSEPDAVGKAFTDVVRMRIDEDARRLAEEVRQVLSGRALFGRQPRADECLFDRQQSALRFQHRQRDRDRGAA